MTITINDRFMEVSAANLLELLEGQSMVQKGVAVAVNEVVVPKSNWKFHQLKEGDQILLIRAAQGG